MKPNKTTQPPPAQRLPTRVALRYVARYSRYQPAWRATHFMLACCLPLVSLSRFLYLSLSLYLHMLELPPGIHYEQDGVVFFCVFFSEFMYGLGS